MKCSLALKILGEKSSLCYEQEKHPHTAAWAQNVTWWSKERDNRRCKPVLESVARSKHAEIIKKLAKGKSLEENENRH